MRVIGIAVVVGLLLVIVGSQVVPWLSEPSPPDVVAGRAYVIDGDSLRVQGHEIRLLGIDAPEGRQTCMRGGKSYPCGRVARNALRRLTSGSVRCEIARRDQHRRLLATCFAGETNINRLLVTQGTVVRFGRRYASEEAAARRAKRGLWAAGSFERPADWRRKNAR